MKNLLGFVSLTVALAAALFLSSGDLKWGMAWVYIILHVSISAISMRIMTAKSPGLLAERLHPGAGVKAWDKLLASVTMLLVPVILIVSGLDRRCGWSADISILIQLVAFIIWLLGNIFSSQPSVVFRLLRILCSILIPFRGLVIQTLGNPFPATEFGY
jgi:hypothetical protein